MALMPWEPFEEMAPLREAMNRMLAENFIGPRRLGLFARAFPVDIRETDTEYVLEASLPGMKAEEIQITATGNAVTVRATTKHEEKIEKSGTYVRQERYEGEVSRFIELPGMIDREKIAATYEQGVLTLRIPKAAEAQGKRVTIQVKGTETTH